MKQKVPFLLLTLVWAVISCASIAKKPNDYSLKQGEATASTGIDFELVDIAEDSWNYLGCACEKTSATRYKLFNYFKSAASGYKIALSNSVGLRTCLSKKTENIDGCQADVVTTHEED